MASEGRCCWNCDWFAADHGTCCNGDSPMCADFPPEPERRGCKAFERRKDDGRGGDK